MEGIDEEKMPAQSPNGWKMLTLPWSNFINDWDSLDYRRQYLYYWRAYYMAVVRPGLALDRITPLEYGEAFPSFVQEISLEMNSHYKPTHFLPRQRTYHPFWYSEEVKKVIEEVKSFWRHNSLDFGELHTVS